MNNKTTKPTPADHERLRLERKFDDRDLIYRLLIERWEDAMMVLDGDQYVDCNPAAVELFACEDKQQLLRCHPSDLSPERQADGQLSRDKEQAYIARTIEQGTFRFEWQHQRLNGEIFTAEVLLTCLTARGENFIHVTLKDISARQKIEEKLQKEQALRTEFIRLAPAFLVAIETNGTIILMNDAMLQATGYRAEDVVGQDYLSIFVPEAERQGLLDFFESHSDSPTPTFRENRILTRDGQALLVEWHGRPVMDDAGQPAYYFGVGLDITDKKKAEAALKQALHEVEALKKRLEQENLYLQNEIKLNHNFEEIIGQSTPLKQVLGQVEQVASTDSTVLILGETGTGKELIARAVHSISPRSRRPLVKVNCAALPANIIESELFGHEKGAFTGAIERKIGRFELAHGGTIFLDEIGDLPLDLQAKLLRVLQDGEFERLGNPKTFCVDVRVIAATNRDLEAAIENNTFREDLYYRLNVFPITLPPLRERKDDIPFLVNHFVRKFCHKTGRHIETIPQKVMDALVGYEWPGNIRELENIIERAVIVNPGPRLEAGEWLPRSKTRAPGGEMQTLEQVERAHILKALERTRWQVSGEKGAAKILDINPNTLVSRMKKLGIQR